MTALEIFEHGHAASINSITLLLPDPTISLLLHSSIRDLSYLIACMATVQGLRTGQRPLLSNPRQDGRKSEPSRSARQEGGEPDTSYPQGAQSLEALRSETVLIDRHVTSRSNPGYGVYSRTYNTSIKAETDRRNHHEM